VTGPRHVSQAYFCGLDVAHNRDSAEDAAKATSLIGGQGIGESEIDKFESWLKAMHALGEARGKHPRYVYRLGVGTEGGEAGYAHVWNIVAQPDGTFYWLQSFVDHYSLPSWMRQSDAKGDRAGAPRAKKGNTERLISLSRRAGPAVRDGPPQA